VKAPDVIGCKKHGLNKRTRKVGFGFQKFVFGNHEIFFPPAVKPEAEFPDGAVAEQFHLGNNILYCAADGRGIVDRTLY
jgi:hypothetical protein